MDKIIYWLKKLGILRVGGFAAKGDAKKMVDMEIESELYQSEEEIDAEKRKKEIKKNIKPAAKKSKNTVGKIIFWFLLAIGVFFLLAFWGSGWSFGTIIGVLIWAIFLRWTWVHVTSGLLALGKIIFLGAVVIVMSFIVATPDEDGMGVDVKIEKSQKEGSKKEDKSSKLAKGVEKDTVAKFLIDLEKETDLDFSKIKDDEVSWTAERVGLKLQKAKSFTAEDLSAKDFDKLQEYFLDLGADTGGLGFTFAPPAGTQSSGFALKDKENSGMMCVLIGTEGDGVWIGCGWGPTNNPNSK
ncbi:hypothetical protein HN784_01350 [bacterium]|jgi:hypothetical protein|nr:hypothetical protein [bacterium]MBT4250912.1 hypothetical protein [bacterium]MBT4597900.1 hypothetical protein [bacterium]MBT6753909.1 hypothetical protein [bacterium]MBT7037338.1 hypothetical protein [bacterium]